MRRQTWIYLVLLAALVGLASYLNRRETLQVGDATPTSGTTLLFDPSVGSVESIEVTSISGESILITRNSDNIWEIAAPDPGEADQGLVESAASQISSLRLISEFDDDPEIFGLTTPEYTISVSFTDDTEHVMEIGDSTPTNSGYYVRLDRGNIKIVGLNGIDSLKNLLQSPPYVSTPTPTESATSDQTITEEVTVTPGP